MMTTHWLFTQDKMKNLLIKQKIILLFSLVLVIGSVLRLYQLGATPLSLTWDEVALGYNAYSIFETGKDEFGKTLPVVLQSFDDYKPALYTYLIIPSYKIFGLNEFAVRLPSAFLGILTLISTYFLIKKLFKRDDIALIVMFLLAISPWHIQMSRVAFESNVGLAFNIFAATFFLYGLKKYWMLIFAAIFAGLSVHTYQSDRVFTPLFVLGMAIIYFKPLMQVPKKYIAISFIAGILIILPLVVYTFTDSNALLRAKGTSVFNDSTVILHDNAKRNEFNIESGNELGKILDNRRIVFAKATVEGYFVHFNPNWLLRGDIARHHAPEMGLIYVWEFPFILIGIYMLLFSKFENRVKYFIFFWFLLAPLPASITTGVPHAIRTLNFLPTWQLFTALGLIAAAIRVSSITYRVLSFKVKYVLIVLFLAFVMFNLLYFLNQYFVQTNYFHARDWLYGHKEMIEEISKRADENTTIIFTDREPFDKAYMYYLFYTQFPPEKYQRIAPSSGNFETHHNFDNFYNRPINWEVDKNENNVLIIGTPSEIPESESVYTVFYPNGSPAAFMAERK